MADMLYIPEWPPTCTVRGKCVAQSIQIHRLPYKSNPAEAGSPAFPKSKLKTTHAIEAHQERPVLHDKSFKPAQSAQVHRGTVVPQDSKFSQSTKVTFGNVVFQGIMTDTLDQILLAESSFEQDRHQFVEQANSPLHGSDAQDDPHGLIAYYKNKPYPLPQHSYDTWEMLSLPPDVEALRLTNNAGSGQDTDSDCPILVDPLDLEDEDIKEVDASGSCVAEAEESESLDSGSKALPSSGVTRIYMQPVDVAQGGTRRTTWTPSPAKSRYPQTIMGIDAPSRKAKGPAAAGKTKPTMYRPHVTFLTPKPTRVHPSVVEDNNALEDFSPQVREVLEDKSFVTPKPPGIAHQPRYLPPSRPSTEPEFSGGEESPTRAPSKKKHKKLKKPAAKTVQTLARRPPSEATIDILPNTNNTVGSRLRGGSKIRSHDVHTFVELNCQIGRRICLFCINGAPGAINLPVSFAIRTSTTSIRKHFFGDHPDTWIPTCDWEEITITSDEYSLKADEWRAKNNMPLTKEPCKMFTTQLFHQFLVNLVVREDLPLRIIDSEAFRRLILLLYDAMEEKNIPHRTSLQKMVFQEWVGLMHWLKAHLQTRVHLGGPQRS
ncbi:hypothetical protein AAF712_014828 [Marasmius tenuissimus]|uniref:Uncharacterized protein n=1 Tax=Marasmius tenuissimus TaxID=585030 RepID=A0ABR2ZAZ4_9AGAR